MKERTFFSPAKVNLFLQVKKRLPSGYHEIATCIQAVDWVDQITFSFSEKDAFTCSDPDLSSRKDNLVWKAVALFREQTGWCQPLSIHLEKHIPVGSGLGGGSSNAATTLWALHRFFPGSIQCGDLQKWAKELGADVAFFFSGGLAQCTGIGERVESIPMTTPFSGFWIIKPSFSLSTATVYQALAVRQKKCIDLHQWVKQFFCGEGEWINDLEIPAFQISKELYNLKKLLSEEGKYPTLMTGSGSAIFSFRPSLPSLPDSYETRFVSPIFRSSEAWYELPMTHQACCHEGSGFTSKDVGVESYR